MSRIAAHFLPRRYQDQLAAQLAPVPAPAVAKSATAGRAPVVKDSLTTAKREADRAWLEANLYAECVCEFKFHPSRKWRFDFAWPSRKVALEIDGGVWRKGGGAHSHPMNIIRDIEKSNEATAHGWRVIRVVTEKFRTPETLALVSRCFTAQTLIP